MEELENLENEGGNFSIVKNVEDVTKVHTDHYGAEDIQVLEGMEAVRKRPGMYIASTSASGLHHLVWEIVDNGIDEAVAGFADEIDVTVDNDNVITVKDNGRGVPVDIHPKTGKSAAETIYTELHAGGKFDGSVYKMSSGLHGVGATVVNALSSWMEVTSEREGHAYYLRFEDGGHTVVPLKEIGPSKNHGTTVRFKADPAIFRETTVYDHNTLREHLRELAFLNKGIKIVFTDERLEDDQEKYEMFQYKGGIKEYVGYLQKGKTVIMAEPLYFEGEEEDILVEVAFQYNEGFNRYVYCYCNNVNTHEGGTHEEGFRMTLSRVINKYGRKSGIMKDNDESLTGDDVREGIVAIVSVKHPNPEYEGQTKTKLGNSEVRKIVSNVFGTQFERYLMENPKEARVIVEKGLLASRARQAAKKAREATRRKSPLEFSALPGKLRDCISRNPAESEIFIVEGDSAGGSATEGRNRQTQAILPLRGKILNVEKAGMHRIFDNAEIKTMITAFGTGVGEDFNIDKLRYHKVIIMSDADVDGAHIRILLLTFFYRFLRPIIEGGYVYFAQPPLFRIQKGKRLDYAYSDEQLEELKKVYVDKYEIQRYKGLGEMDADQLFETTMDPETRTLVKVNIENAMEADQVFEMLMGEEVEPRKQFIMKNAHFVKDIDL
ncbi:MAG: DNA topoisomerase (ATP-hydrolyzing) subunit B [Erysipelotrichales bacterium]|nr:DNA topoisomerase (ATP-hydrolyzing) subunit B [Erysipelotrichales bacterium]